MRLVLVRHAEAAPGEPDEQRALTPRGREQSRALAVRLAREHPGVDAVLTSPLRRARETAGPIADALGVAAEPDPRLAPGATADALREAVAGRGGTVVVVGHQPDCGRIAVALGADPEPAFPTAGAFVLDL
jgi:phosphohistidine phosphatase